MARNWSTARSWAESTNWSNAAASQRVYEYAVEPAVLQNLPDQALLLVTRGSGGPVLRSVECDPAIVTLPRVSARPLPDPADVRSAGQGTGTPPGPGRAQLPSPGGSLDQAGPDSPDLGVRWTRSGSS